MSLKLCVVAIALSACATDDLESDELAVTDDGTLLLGPWGTPTKLAMSSDYEELHPTISADGLTMFYNVRVNDVIRLYTTSRSARDAAWNYGVPTESALTYARETDLADDGHTLYSSYQRPITWWDIAVSTKECNSAPWTSP